MFWEQIYRLGSALPLALGYGPMKSAPLTCSTRPKFQGVAHRSYLHGYDERRKQSWKCRQRRAEGKLQNRVLSVITLPNP